MYFFPIPCPGMSHGQLKMSSGAIIQANKQTKKTNLKDQGLFFNLLITMTIYFFSRTLKIFVT
jgi:hypothetical protein